MSLEDTKIDGMYAAVIPKFIDSLIRYESPLIYGDGEQTRDFTYIENVVSMNTKALTTKIRIALVSASILHVMTK